VLRIFLKLISFFIVIPLIGYIAYRQLDAEGFFRLQKIEIVIQSSEKSMPPYLQPLVEKIESRLSGFKGTSLVKLNMQKIYQDLFDLNWIQNVQLVREWPAALRVEIVPQAIKFLYMSKKGSLFPVMADGRIADAINPATAPDVAVLNGEAFVENQNLRSKVITMLEEIPDKGPFSPQNISEIKYESKDGFWISLIKSGIQVKMGDDQFVIKGARVNQVLEYLDTNEFKARVIDATLSQKVLVRLRKDP